MKGRRHLAMPRINQITVSQRSTEISARVGEKTGRISPKQPATYSLAIQNHGNHRARFGHTLHIPPGIEPGKEPGQESGQEPRQITVKGGEEETFDISLGMEEGFDVPALSFTTVLATSRIKMARAERGIPLIVSAGFEKGQE